MERELATVTVREIAEIAAEQPKLIHHLSGFMDAGSAAEFAMSHLLESLEHRVIAVFDIDALYDYRSRRPMMTFSHDKFTTAEIPELLLYEVTDEVGQKFLLLKGPEPDFAWQRFADTVADLIEIFDVPLTIGMHAIPWPTPHTRPVGITRHATNPHLITDSTTWVGEVDVPGHMAAFLEYWLGERDLDAMGFTAHVPHYLANAEYPRAALTLLEALSAATGLVFPMDPVREAAQRSDQEINAQIAQDSENSAAVHTLEQQYDAYVSQQHTPLFREDETTLPTGDELAAQLESFLADVNRHDESSGDD